MLLKWDAEAGVRMDAPEFRVLAQNRVARSTAPSTKAENEAHFRVWILLCHAVSLFLFLLCHSLLFSLTSYSMQKVPHKSSHSYAAAAGESTLQILRLERYSMHIALDCAGYILLNVLNFGSNIPKEVFHN